MIRVTSETFEAEVLQSTIPVLLDFWGPRCVPCIQLDPFVDELSNQFNGRLKIAKVIAPENRQLCLSLKVMGLPSFVAFNGGREVARLTGEVTRESLAQMVNSIVSRK